MQPLKPTFVLVSVMLLLSECGANADNEEFIELEQAKEASILSAKEVRPEEKLDFYVEKEMALSLYEPEEGCYLGAYILSNKLVEFEIESFEQLTQKEHSMYTFYTKMGNPFPADWVLSCIAGMKTPNIVLGPENESYPFDTHNLVQTAKKFGEFYVPVFLQFYPDQREKGYSPDEYIAFYREAREVFRQHASNVAFVWNVPEDLLDLNAYYPGDAYVDWVGLSVYETIDPGGESLFGPDVFDRIDYVYYEFQERKPMMISQLGISHYSEINHAYYTRESGEEMERFYQMIQKNYPRIKAVVYMDYNGMDAVNQSSGEDNFTVTGNEQMLEYYKRAIKHTGYLSVVDFSSGGEAFTMLVKSPFKACKMKENYYIDGLSTIYDLEMGKTPAQKEALKEYVLEINGKPYYDTAILSINDFDIKIDTFYGRIVARKKL